MKRFWIALLFLCAIGAAAVLRRIVALESATVAGPSPLAASVWRRDPAGHLRRIDCEPVAFSGGERRRRLDYPPFPS
jgi:hypothetical protein